MRFVWAVAAFVLAALLIGAGIAQRTVFAGPGSHSVDLSAASTQKDAPYLLIDSSAMALQPGTQTLSVTGSNGVFVAYGRTADIRSWLSDQSYELAAADDKGAVVVTAVEPKRDAAATTDPTQSGSAAADAAAPHKPAGSDLWLGEFSADTSLTQRLQIPSGTSVLVASDGVAPAPSQITIAWPVSSTTPWAGPLIVLGGLFLIAGIVLYGLGIRHARRSRGPRRKAPPPLPVTQPIDIAVEGEDKGVISSTPSRRSLGRRGFVAIPLLLAAPLVFAGCSPEAWPQLAGTSAPTPTSSAVDASGQQRPAVTDAQASQIVQRIAQTVAQADTNRDATLAATRLGGAALAARTTNYTLRSQLSDYKALPAIPSDSLQITLPQAYDEWPRTVMVVADQSTTSTIMMLTQQDPWANYKLVYAGDLGASTQLPDLAPWYIGASQVPPDSTFLTIPPDKLAAAYADVLTHGSASSFASLFDQDADAFGKGVAADRQKRLDDFNATGNKTGTLEFGAAAGTQPPLALATLESGAIVAVTIDETDTVKPTQADVLIKFDNNPTVKALTGVSESQTGVTTTFQDQLFFYVPAQGSSEKIRVLGYSSNILDAKVLP